MHNVHYMLALMGAARDAIVRDEYPGFVRGFFEKLYGGDRSKVPEWATEALESVGVELV